MKISRLIPALAFLTIPAFAQTADRAFLDQFEKTFEQGGSVAVTDFVPEAQMRGALHTVAPMADNDGLNNTYFVDTSAGVLEVTGTPALLARIREIYALDHLRGLSKTEEFGKALGKSVESKVKSVGGIVRDPIGTIKNVPKGASRFFGRNAYRVKLDGHRLVWVTREGDKEVRSTSEPGAGLMKRGKSQVIGWLPIEWLL